MTTKAKRMLIDASKEDYLRQPEPKLVRGALVVADNTGIARRETKPYLDHARTDPRYARVRR